MVALLAAASVDPKVAALDEKSHRDLVAAPRMPSCRSCMLSIGSAVPR